MSISSIQKLIQRKIGSVSENFKLELIGSAEGYDIFELQSIDDSIVIRGSSESALASGFNWYLKHECHNHLSWCGSRLDLPAELPMLHSPIRHRSPYQLRYHLNYCTYSYSMPFWDWNRWEQELDFMSLNGINLMLTVTGLEEVWRRTLLRLGYTEEAVSDYICGPAFFAWQWMQNLTAWGGPLPLWWYDEQAELARKIRNRMNELGIKAVVQGFSGMVPRDFKKKFPESSPVDQGLWCGFDRPLLLLPTDPKYTETASIYYEELHRLYGTDIHHYSMDPFHEGGRADGLDIAAYAREVERSLLEHDPEAVWVLQAWEGNPKPELIGAIAQEHTLILDLWCESRPAWKETNAFQGHPWIWNMIQNYGGKNGLYGNLKIVAGDPLKAWKNPAAGQMSGIGLAMEGIGTNPVMYDLLTDMVWRESEPELEDWLAGYITRRYGKAPVSARKAWALLEKSVYNSSVVQQGTSESLLCARPALEIRNVSTWGPRGISYEPEMVREACRQLYQSYEICNTSEGYLYDLVDVTRQCLADLSREFHEQTIKAFLTQDILEFDVQSSRFLKLLEDQDRLLQTREEFLLGPWLEAARTKGRTEEEKRLFEYNARTLITVWGPESSATVLKDYSHREWSGLLSSFYGPRWKMYFEALRKSMLTESDPIEPDWFIWEHHWTCEYDSNFAIEPKGSIKEEVPRIIAAYL
ncbi:alpha-N-acetylglucosaminidase [Paenibacillus sp. Marseille-Q4541]|uniref:alpha-N-acetylglucosaminidase n=1 Tax=Paenibacillus sp. Marseille-Q4541 TaxID=2831522 RepID=UPI001BAE517A|nr:alpha-N-acetylglucosaminidase [Paenibacillus sp. Marseille-Q4541]